MSEKQSTSYVSPSPHILDPSCSLWIDEDGERTLGNLFNQKGFFFQNANQIFYKIFKLSIKYLVFSSMTTLQNRSNQQHIQYFSRVVQGLMEII